MSTQLGFCCVFLPTPGMNTNLHTMKRHCHHLVAVGMNCRHKVLGDEPFPKHSLTNKNVLKRQAMSLNSPPSGRKDRLYKLMVLLITCSLTEEKKIVPRGEKTQLCTSLNRRWHILKVDRFFKVCRIWECDKGEQEGRGFLFPLSMSVSLPMTWESLRAILSVAHNGGNGNKIERDGSHVLQFSHSMARGGLTVESHWNNTLQISESTREGFRKTQTWKREYEQSMWLCRDPPQEQIPGPCLLFPDQKVLYPYPFDSCLWHLPQFSHSFPHPNILYLQYWTEIRGKNLVKTILSYGS